MKRITLIGGMVLGLAITSTQSWAGGSCGLAPGESEIIYQVEDVSPYVASTEGIAADWVGNLYVSHRIGSPGAWSINEIIRITPWGETRVVADFGPAAPGTFGLLGLTTDWRGNVYAAFAAGNENHGVWKIHRNGRKERLSGSEQIVVPNDLVMDWCGNLYVTDSYPADPADPGLVWKYGRRSRHFEPWAASHLLAPDPVLDPVSPPPPLPPFPAPGANGVAFVPPNHLYVANSEKSLVLHIPVMRSGRAGEVTVIAGEYPAKGPPGLLFVPDGLSVDLDGNVYAVVAPVGFTGFPLSPVIRIDPATGEIEAVVEPFVVPSPLFEFPTSLTFGGWFSGRKCLYVANSGAAVFGIPGGLGAKVTKVGVGVRGIPLQ